MLFSLSSLTTKEQILDKLKSAKESVLDLKVDMQKTLFSPSQNDAIRRMSSLQFFCQVFNLTFLYKIVFLLVIFVSSI